MERGSDLKAANNLLSSNGYEMRWNRTHLDKLLHKHVIVRGVRHLGGKQLLDVHKLKCSEDSRGHRLGRFEPNPLLLILVAHVARTPKKSAQLDSTCEQFNPVSLLDFKQSFRCCRVVH